jgi:hypothetical protein
MLMICQSPKPKQTNRDDDVGDDSPDPYHAQPSTSLLDAMSWHNGRTRHDIGFGKHRTWIDVHWREGSDRRVLVRMHEMTHHRTQLWAFRV